MKPFPSTRMCFNDDYTFFVLEVALHKLKSANHF